VVLVAYISTKIPDEVFHSSSVYFLIPLQIYRVVYGLQFCTRAGMLAQFVLSAGKKVTPWQLVEKILGGCIYMSDI
jgi:hypothetical protein